MCWSDSADLVVGSAVVAVGLGGLTVVRHRRDLAVAGLPLLLGAHQLVESRIWARSPGEGATITGPAVVAWAVIAFALLPGLVPIAVLVSERRRRPVQWVCAAVGLAVAGVLGAAIAGGAHAVDHGRVLDYGVGVPAVPVLIVAYLVATVGPFVTSPEPSSRRLGWALAVGAVVAAAVDVLAFASVWCAFAAVVSVLVVRRTWRSAHDLAPEAV